MAGHAGEEDTKASLADLESGIAHPGAQSPAGPKVMDLQTAMSPVSVLPPQQIPGGAGNAGGDGAPPAAGWRLPPRAGGNASGDEDDDEPGSPVVGSPEQLQWRLSNTSVEAAAARRFDAGNPLLLQQQGQQRGAAPGSPRGPPGLARKKSVSFAADDGVRALVRGGGGGGAPDLAPGRRAPAMVPVSPYAQQLPSAYAQQAAPSSSSASRFRWAPEQDDAAAEEEQWHDAEELGEESVLHTRRSVDVRMADTATLHLVRSYLAPTCLGRCAACLVRLPGHACQPVYATCVPNKVRPGPPHQVAIMPAFVAGCWQACSSCQGCRYSAPRCDRQTSWKCVALF